jgi:hypothetical protein
MKRVSEVNERSWRSPSGFSGMNARKFNVQKFRDLSFCQNPAIGYICGKLTKDDEVRVSNPAGISGFRRGTRRFGFRDASSTTSTCYSSGYRSACTAGARFPARSGSGSASAAGSEFAAWRARGSWKCVRRKREWRRVEFPWEGCSLFGSWHEHRYLGRKELEH